MSKANLRFNSGIFCRNTHDDVTIVFFFPLSRSLLKDCVQLNQYKLKDEIGKVP